MKTVITTVLLLFLATAAHPQQNSQIYERGRESRIFQQQQSTESEQQGAKSSRSRDTSATRGDQFTITGSVDAGALIYEALMDFESKSFLPPQLRGTLIERVHRWRVLSGQPRFILQYAPGIDISPHNRRFFSNVSVMGEPVNHMFFGSYYEVRFEDMVFPWVCYGELIKRSLELLPAAAEKLSNAGDTVANQQGQPIASNEQTARRIAVAALILASRDPVTQQRAMIIFSTLSNQGTFGGGGIPSKVGALNITATEWYGTKPAYKNYGYFFGGLVIDPVERTATLNNRPYVGPSGVFGREAKIEIAQNAAWQKGVRESNEEFATFSRGRESSSGSGSSVTTGRKAAVQGGTK